MIIDLSIVILFLVINLWIGYQSSKSVTDFSIFSVGHRSFSSFLIFCTLTATFVGGGYTFGTAASVFNHGMVFSLALLGFSLKEILVATIIAPRMGKYSDCHSVGDMIDKTYGKRAKIATGIFSLLICGGILGAQVGALTVIIHSTLNINTTLGVMISLLVLLIYASLGGMRAVVFTDLFQGIILLIGIPLTFFIGLNHVGGWQHVTTIVPHSYLHFLTTGKDWLFFVFLFLTFMLGETLVPPYVQRLFMASSIKQTAKGILLSGLVSIPIFLISGGIGLIAYASNNQIDANTAFPFIVNEMLPIGLRGFIIAALLSIILSSAAGFLNAASISFVNDLVKPLSKSPEKINFLKMARISTILVGIISILFALTIKNVLSLLLAAYNFWSPIILIPLIAAIFNVNAKERDFFIGALCGITGSLVWEFVLNDPYNISPILLGLLCNLIGFMISLSFRKNSKKMDDQQSITSNI